MHQSGLTEMNNPVREAVIKSASWLEQQIWFDILNAFRDVVAFYGTDHRIIWINEAGKSLLKIKDDSYVGNLCHSIWFGADGPCETCPIVSRKFETTERLLTLGGNKIWMVRHTPLFREDGTIAGFIEFRADVTRLSNLEMEIIDEREKYRMLAENTPFGLLLTQNNKLVYLNKTLINWLEISSLSGFGKSELLEFFHPDDRKLAEKFFNRKREKRVPSAFMENVRIITRDGVVHYYRFDQLNSTINGKEFVQTVMIDNTNEVLKEKQQKKVAADALYINQKNAILSDIETVLSKTLADPKFASHSGEFDRIFNIINSYKQLDRDWNMLIANFEEIYPGFFSRLKTTHPSLSSNDLRHCACIKLNFGTKEIARFFNIKAPSVQISRVRLKKKMNLSDDSDLRSYIIHF